MLWYLLNLSIILIFIILYLITRQTNKRWSKINDYLGKVTNTVNSVRYGNLSTKIDDLGHPTYQNVTESINRMVETLKDREKMIVEYQSELMRQNKLLENVINSLSDGILIVNDKFNILRATPKIIDWFGTKGAEIVGKNINDFIQLPEDIMLEKASNQDVFIMSTPTNNFILNTINLNYDDKKRYILLIKDVTNEREIETLKEDFVATLTHDLKVPIVAESNMLNFFLNETFGSISDKQRTALTNMQKSNQELLDLVQIILDTYKINKAGITLEKEEVNLNDFVKCAVEEMKPIAQNSNLHLDYYPAEKTIKTNIDSMQMTRVIKNLISNAISHSNTKEKIDVKIAEIPNFITISIIDYGQGISKDEIKLIFNKYYSAAKKFRKIGTGLGLYLSQQITKAHGGEILVTSEKDIKTEFCVKIPK